MKQRKQSGVTLIESMIALLVISVGLLGIAALQLTSMKQNNSALQHSKAVWMAYTMADRVRANGNDFESYKSINTSKTDYSNEPSCVQARCSQADMARSDARDWFNEVITLPAGRGITNLANNTLTISVMWDDEGTGATGEACGSDPAVDLACYSVTLTQ